MFMQLSILRKRGFIGFTIAFFIALAFTAGTSSGARSSPAEGKTLLSGSAAPMPVRAILQRACQDCHSKNTRWPWYGRIPPVSWQMQSDVERGRAFMDLSKWNEYTAGQRRGFMLAILASTETHMMPPPKYVWMHSNANLSGKDLEVLRGWVVAERERTARTR